MMMMTSSYYDHNAHRYEERSFARLDLDVLKHFGSRLPVGARVLDAGCGPGRDLRFFIREGFRAEGLDLSPSMAEAARRNSGAGTVHQTDLQLFSAPRESYDGVWAHRSLIHLPAHGVQRVMGIFFSILKPGGLLFASIEEGEGEYEDRTDDPSGPARKIYRYRRDDFASLMRQSGFILQASGHEVGRPERLGFMAQRLGPIS